MKYEKKIIHLIHADTVGGIEVGAKLAQSELINSLDYQIKYIFNINDNVITKLKKLVKVTKEIFKESKGKKDQVILSSLWMSHIISFILRILLKNITWIAFIHNSNYPNIINYLICTKLTRLADKQVFDSYSTAKAYDSKKINRERIINFFFPNYKLKKFDIKNWSNRKYDFIIVARNTKQKGFLEIEKFCLSISNSYPSRPKFVIITNNLKKAVNLEELKRKLNPICDINFKTNLTNSEVLEHLAEAKIYFCLSHFEGFGMTIVESILSGCFVVTTNAGEQQYYLWPGRRLIINNTNSYKLDFNYINENGPSKENFIKTKDFLLQNVKTYSESLRRIVMESN